MREQLTRLCTLTVALSLLATSAVAFDFGSHALPDSRVTPGSTNPNVTQFNIQETICVPGYTKTIRPPARYTSRLKREQLTGYADRRMRDYEEDHLIPLELGGSPTDPRNLWPEPRGGPWGARTKDRLENTLHRLVCEDRVPLATAQHAIATDWIAAYERYEEAVTTNTPSLHSESQTLTTNSAVFSDGASAKCADGTYSYSKHRRGSCSRHGGVAAWK
ncbi:MAG TPA: DUF3761 domain-containing protein [Rhizomicrobium sp.]|nr:DUF3761 domain-containing protein [Rhizomicrobium sp.]